MKAIVLEKIGGPECLVLQERDRPALMPGTAIVRVRAAGVCYRDVIDRKGGFPHLVTPVVPGHEFAGEVVEVAPDVTSVKAGDRVANLHRAPCKRCEYCLRGHEVRCRNAMIMFGHTTDGGYAEYVRAEEGALVCIPDA